MSPRVDHRQLAQRQRRHLKAEGYTDREIQVFAQIFTTRTDERDEPRFVCADQTQEDHR